MDFKMCEIIFALSMRTIIIWLFSPDVICDVNLCMFVDCSGCNVNMLMVAI